MLLQQEAHLHSLWLNKKGIDTGAFTESVIGTGAELGLTTSKPSIVKKGFEANQQ